MNDIAIHTHLQHIGSDMGDKGFQVNIPNLQKVRETITLYHWK